MINIFRYGFHVVRSSYWVVPNADVTKQLFADLRKDQKYPTAIGANPVKHVRDLTTGECKNWELVQQFWQFLGYDNSQPDGKAVLPLSTSSEMVTFTLANGSVATLRASGTEPKIKYYIELKTEPGKQQRYWLDFSFWISTKISFLQRSGRRVGGARWTGVERGRDLVEASPLRADFKKEIENNIKANFLCWSTTCLYFVILLSKTSVFG